MTYKIRRISDGRLGNDTYATLNVAQNAAKMHAHHGKIDIVRSDGTALPKRRKATGYRVMRNDHRHMLGGIGWWEMSRHARRKHAVAAAARYGVNARVEAIY